ncbi:MAG: hypothetical protein CL878_12740 [Dehalococcoidia bacterium]|nr:hypothetical protein [Dehalococcoidia bacterium]
MDAHAQSPDSTATKLRDPPFVLPTSVELRTDVVYVHHGSQDLQLDLFIPQKPGHGRPAVAYLHGGGWHSGTRRQFWRHAAHMATQGFVGATAQYRFAPTHPFPAAVEDAQAAVRWLRCQAATLGIAADLIGAVGGSAGGHLAALLGTTDVPVEGVSSRVQAVVAFNGEFDLPAFLATPVTTDERMSHAVQDFVGPHPRTAQQASPLHQADRQAAPTLPLHGTADSLVPFTQSVAFQQRLQALGVPAEHGFFNHSPYYQRALPVMAQFLVQVLGEGAALPPHPAPATTWSP